MCGIVGVYSVSAPDLSREEICFFVDSLAHRGPDGRGIYRDKSQPCWLGHRRLNILDLSAAGSQPMTYGNERYWIVFNGEIYNFLELRRELEIKGYSFRTTTDTEVILASYMEWGEECQLKFNGMWAFAIWDCLQAELFLSRDRFGVKPLYYAFQNGRFAFASELKSFCALDSNLLQFDVQEIANALQNSAEMGHNEGTFLKGVYQLLAGHSLRFNSSCRLQKRKWWETLDHLVEPAASFEGQVEEFQAIFSDACRIRARSDVSIGTALSGGVDSSSVFCKLWELQANPAIDKTRWTPNCQKVFSAFFPNTSQNEYEHVKEILQTRPAKAYEIPIFPETFIPHLDKMCYDFEGIFDLSVGPWLLYREYRRNQTPISLDGHGADELFGGYHHQVEIAQLESLKEGRLPRYFELRDIYRHLFPAGSFRQPAKLSWILGKHLAKRFLSTQGQFDRLRRMGQMLRGKSATSIGDWLQIKSNCPPGNIVDSPAFQRLSLLNQCLYLDFHRNTLPIILRNFDRCSMAHGVEIRAPFLDFRLVCFAFSLPSSSKIGGGFTKRIVRKAMHGLVPKAILLRKDKIGFASPLEEWVKGGLRPFICDTLNSSSFLSSSIWDGPRIRDYVEKCFKKEDYGNARKCWEFVQTDRLIQLFRAKSLGHAPFLAKIIPASTV